jgi:hypothetical protein
VLTQKLGEDMAKVHQFILNAFNAGAIVFMMGDDSDQMEFATETGTPLMSYNVERGRAEEIMAVPEVIELTRKARADEYISIAEFDDTINAIKKVNGFGSWLLNKGANQVQLRNMLGALDRDAPPSPPIAGRKDAIMERPEVSRINPVIIRDESGIEIYLQPYISNIMASGGDKVETVGVALCLHFADNAAANEFISTHKYEGWMTVQNNFANLFNTITANGELGWGTYVSAGLGLLTCLSTLVIERRHYVEFDADAAGTKLYGKESGLTSLEKLHNQKRINDKDDPNKMTREELKEAGPWVSAAYSVKKSILSKIGSRSHPSHSRRIRNLEQIDSTENKSR